jgi:hypothetical protein
MGQELITSLAVATGLPQEMISKEIIQLIEKSGKKPEEVSLEDLRRIVADYLQDTLLALKESIESLS